MCYKLQHNNAHNAHNTSSAKHDTFAPFLRYSLNRVTYCKYDYWRDLFVPLGQQNLQLRHKSTGGPWTRLEALRPSPLR